MKIIRLSLILSLIIQQVCCAQGPTTLPSPSPTERRTCNNMISNYQASTIHTTEHSSFLIKTFDETTDVTGSICNCNGLGDYLVNNQADNCYLHIYVASKSNDGSDQFLVITGVTLIGGVLKHDPNSKIWKTTKTDPCCIIDDGLDGSVSNDINGCNVDPCDIGYVPNQPPDVTHTAEWNPLMQNIQWYQMAKNNTPCQSPITLPSTINSTESFLISANEIRDYLRSGTPSSQSGTPVPPNPNAQNAAKYLHFYYGSNDQSNSSSDELGNKLSIKDSLAIITIGVNIEEDATEGYHVFSKSGSLIHFTNYVFDEGLPCPLCNINFDAKLDCHFQYVGQTYTPENIYKIHPEHIKGMHQRKSKK